MPVTKTRRQLLKAAALGSCGVVLAACQPQVVVETVVQEVEKVVKETVIVEGEEKVVEKVVKETVIVEKEVPSASVKPATLNLTVGLEEQTTEPLMNDMLARFREEYGIEVQVNAPPPYVGYFEKMLTLIAGGTGPDVAHLIAYWTAVFGKAGILLRLEDFLEVLHEDLDQFDPVLLGSYCQWQGRTHALPLNTNVQGLVYLKEHFENAGITAPEKAEDAWTWSDFETVCQRLMDSNEIECPYGIYGGAPQGRLIQVYQNGKGIVSEALDEPALDSPEAIEALEHIQGLFVKGYTVPEIWTSADPRFGGTELLKAGRVSIFHGGQWHIPWADENLPDTPWGVTYLQKQAQLTTVPGGDTYAAFAASKAPVEAVSLVSFLTNEENQRIWNTPLFRIPGHKALLQPGAMTYPSHQAEMDLFIDQLRYGSQHMLTEYYSEGWSKTDAMLRQRTAEIATGQKQAADWAQEVSDVIRGFIAEGGI